MFRRGCNSGQEKKCSTERVFWKQYGHVAGSIRPRKRNESVIRMWPIRSRARRVSSCRDFRRDVFQKVGFVFILSLFEL